MFYWGSEYWLLSAGWKEWWGGRNFWRDWERDRNRPAYYHIYIKVLGTEVAIHGYHPVLLFLPNMMDLQKKFSFFLAQLYTNLLISFLLDWVLLSFALFQIHKSILLLLPSANAHLGCVKLLVVGFKHLPQNFEGF